MEEDVRARGYSGGEFRNTGRSSYGVEFSHGAQPFRDCQHVYRLLRGAELLDGFVDLLVCRLVERFGFEKVADGGVGVFLKHERAQNGFFNFYVARGDASVLFQQTLLGRLAVGP